MCVYYKYVLKINVTICIACLQYRGFVLSMFDHLFMLIPMDSISILILDGFSMTIFILIFFLHSRVINLFARDREHWLVFAISASGNRCLALFTVQICRCHFHKWKTKTVYAKFSLRIKGRMFKMCVYACLVWMNELTHACDNLYHTSFWSYNVANQKPFGNFYSWIRIEKIGTKKGKQCNRENDLKDRKRKREESLKSSK